MKKNTLLTIALMACGAQIASQEFTTFEQYEAFDQKHFESADILSKIISHAKNIITLEEGSLEILNEFICLRKDVRDARLKGLLKKEFNLANLITSAEKSENGAKEYTYSMITDAQMIQYVKISCGDTENIPFATLGIANLLI